MSANDLTTYLFAGPPHPLEPALQTWLAARRFAAFVEGSKSKIRKKLRAAEEPESVLDVRLELETAFLLLQERPFSVVYEPPAGGARAPDFAVSFTSHSTFMLEITRLRDARGLTLERLGNAVCSKLGQFSAGSGNVLLVGVSSLTTDDALQTALTELLRRAEQHDPEVLKRSRLRNWGDFFRHVTRLSEVLVRSPQEPGALSVWTNPQAKHPLPSKVRTALYRSQRAV